MATQSIVNVNNEGLTVGRGQVLFALLNSENRLPKNAPFEHIGNCPEFNLTVETEDLEHFSSERGIGEKDASITLRTNRTGTLTCDNIRDANLARFLFGEVQTITQSALSVTGEEIEDVQLGLYYQLGIDTDNDTGVKNITDVVVQSDDVVPVTYVVDEDYLVDPLRGMIRFLADGDIVEGSTVVISYDVTESTFRRIVSGNAPIRVAVKYIAENPVGPSREILMKNVIIRPEGDLGLISGDDWATVSLALEVLTDPVKNVAIYLDNEALPL